MTSLQIYHVWMVWVRNVLGKCRPHVVQGLSFWSNSPQVRDCHILKERRNSTWLVTSQKCPNQGKLVASVCGKQICLLKYVGVKLNGVWQEMCSKNRSWIIHPKETSKKEHRPYNVNPESSFEQRKKNSYFPWNSDCFIEILIILIMVYEIIPTELDSFSSPNKKT